MGDEEGHEAQGHEGCRRGGTHEGHEGDESHEGHEGDEEGHEGDESHEGHEGNEEVKCGGDKCYLSSLLVGDDMKSAKLPRAVAGCLAGLSCTNMGSFDTL